MPSKHSSVLLPVFAPILIALVLSAALYITLGMATEQSDRVALDKEKAAVERVVSHLRVTLAHDQESVTVWDDALAAVRANEDHEWLDHNLGSWMGTYFGHDGAFVLRADGTAILSFLVGKKGKYADFQEVATSANALVAKLRDRLRIGDQTGISDRVLSIGESDFAYVDGRPAIISAKPIVSDSGRIEQVPGEEFLHVAVQFLESGFLEKLGDRHAFEELGFASVATDDGRAYAAIRNVAGKTLGYLAWKPFRPGTAVLARTVPGLAVLSLALTVVMGMLGWINWKRSTRLKASQEELEHLAHNDVLTGLPNRATFTRELSAILCDTESQGVNAVFYLDLDRFKEVNDTLGHPVGDKLIVQVANRLRKEATSDIVARIGGDEFAMAVSRKSSDDIEQLCDRMVAAVRKPFNVDGHPIIIGLSIGVCIADRATADPSELIRKADIALYHAKSTGRNRFAIFGAHMDELVRAKRELEHDLREALESGEGIEVYYQPIFAAADHRLKGVEALARWRHPDKGMVAPDVFVPVAEETRLIETLGQAVLRQACLDAAGWGDLQVAVNVSAVELRSDAFADRVMAILEQTDFDPKRLEIELTETALEDNSGNCERNIERLRALGIRFALDDFGTGFSSFGRLQKLDVDRIKIDKCYVHGFDKPGGNEEIVRAMIGLAQAKGLATTAEGIETPEQGGILREMGCDDLQGYLFSKPVPASLIAEIVHPRRKAC